MEKSYDEVQRQTSWQFAQWGSYVKLRKQLTVPPTTQAFPQKTPTIPLGTQPTECTVHITVIIKNKWENGTIQYTARVAINLIKPQSISIYYCLFIVPKEKSLASLTSIFPKEWEICSGRDSMYGGDCLRKNNTIRFQYCTCTLRLIITKSHRGQSFCY